MIDINHVTMRFNLGIEKEQSVKELFIRMFQSNKQKQATPQEEFYALTDVDLHIHAGEVVGLIGSNGAGKSTLLKIVSGVMKPTKGNVATKGKISPMIELGAGFDPELTAKENIYLNGAILGYTKKFIQEKFDDIVEFSELHDFLDVPIRNFSSGMTAKLAFSIATVVDPEILIVDEILSVGDLKFQEKSKKKMMSMIRGGTTVLYVSHSLALIHELCNRVVWLEHGKVRMFGTADEVCNHYWAEQMGYVDEHGNPTQVNPDLYKGGNEEHEDIEHNDTDV